MSDEHKPHEPAATSAGSDETATLAVHAPEAHTPDADFAASEQDMTPALEATPEPAPVSDTPRPIWSDAGDAPFEGGEEKAPVLKDEPAKAPRASASGDGPKSAGSETVEMLKTVIFALLIAFVLRVLLFQPFTIPSASMEPNLYEGDYIVVSKWAYGYSKFSSGLPINLPLGEGRVFGRVPERGDIVVFKLPRDDKTDYIKRVIGLPGDRIQMIANKLHINGQPVEDVAVGQSEIADMFGPRAVVRSRETLPNGKSFVTQDFGPGGDLDDTLVYEVPAGHYFMMGDNRDNSIDSRVAESGGVGLVPEQNLVGKAEIIMFSWEPGASLLNPISWFSKIRPSRFFHVLD